MNGRGECERLGRIPYNEFSEQNTGDMPSMDKLWHILNKARLPGETIEETEWRLRRVVGPKK